MIPRFRAWTGKLVEYDVVPLNKNEIIEAQLMTGDTRIRKVDAIDMSTGSEDKNDKEMFEGDLLQPDSKEWLAEVRWVEGAGRFEFHVLWQKDKNCLYDIRESRPYRYTIVGNIHENPELLKKK